VKTWWVQLLEGKRGSGFGPAWFGRRGLSGFYIGGCADFLSRVDIWITHTEKKTFPQPPEPMILASLVRRSADKQKTLFHLLFSIGTLYVYGQQYRCPTTIRSSAMRKQISVVCFLTLFLIVPPCATAQQDMVQPETVGLNLITDNAEEGFQLAIVLARKGVTETQPDIDVLKKLRPAYAHDPDSLIAASQVVAIHFQTIAAANNYWREKN
jgi:hypothetical protein